MVDTQLICSYVKPQGMDAMGAFGGALAQGPLESSGEALGNPWEALGGSGGLEWGRPGTLKTQ